MKEDLIKIINDQLERAFQLGQSFYYFKRDIHIYLSLADINYKEENLESVYNTFLFLKYSAGNYKTNIAVVDEFSYWQYIQIDRPSFRKKHQPFANLVFRWDDPIWDILYPPKEWNCGCYIDTLTEGQIKSRGLKVENGQDFIAFAKANIHQAWQFNPAITDWRKFFNKFIVNSLKLSGEKNVQK